MTSSKWNTKELGGNTTTKSTKVKVHYSRHQSRQPMTRITKFLFTNFPKVFYFTASGSLYSILTLGDVINPDFYIGNYCFFTLFLTAIQFNLIPPSVQPLWLGGRACDLIQVSCHSATVDRIPLGTFIWTNLYGLLRSRYLLLHRISIFTILTLNWYHHKEYEKCKEWVPRGIQTWVYRRLIAS